MPKNIAQQSRPGHADADGRAPQVPSFEELSRTRAELLGTCARIVRRLLRTSSWPAMPRRDRLRAADELSRLASDTECALTILAAPQTTDGEDLRTHYRNGKQAKGNARNRAVDAGND